MSGDVFDRLEAVEARAAQLDAELTELGGSLTALELWAARNGDRPVMGWVEWALLVCTCLLTVGALVLVVGVLA